MNSNEWLETGMLTVMQAVRDYIELESKSYQIAFCTDFLKWFSDHFEEYVDKVYAGLEEEVENEI